VASGASGTRSDRAGWPQGCAGTKQARLAEQRITVLESIAHDGVPLPKPPDKIANRPSRFKMSD